METKWNSQFPDDSDAAEKRIRNLRIAPHHQDLTVIKASDPILQGRK